MGRVIKFRAWDREVKDMRYGVGITPDSDLNIPYKITPTQHNPEFISYYPESTLMQFTGLQDKNGVEIYEGDVYQYIIQGHFGGYYQEFEHTAIVHYENGAFCVGEYLLIDALEGDDEAKIIGNIYENPELLEVPS